jgi:spore germination protein YaaH
MQRRSRVAVALALATAALTPVAATAVEARAAAGALVRSGSVTGWVPHWHTATGTSAFQSGADRGLFTEVSPFWFSVIDATTVRSVGAVANLASTTRAARAKGLRVIPTITDGTGKLVLQAILADPTTRTAHVDTIVGLVMTGVDGIAFDGIDIDYEGFAFADGRESWPTTQPLWLAFVQELGDKLHAQGRLLSITVPPIWDDGRSGYWVYGPWNQITPYADRLRLMVYDWSVAAPGPIAPLSWVRNVISFVQKSVPASDLGEVWLGVPTYGRSWARVSGECPAALPTGVSLATTSVQTGNAAALAASHGSTITDAKDSAGRLEGEKTFSWNVGTFTGPKPVSPAPGPYVPPSVVAREVPRAADATGLAPAIRLRPVTIDVTCTITRVVHVPDSASVVQRAQLALAAGLGGIAIWALGYESPDLWQALAAG